MSAADDVGPSANEGFGISVSRPVWLPTGHAAATLSHSFHQEREPNIINASIAVR
jgi:hypothetical protein